MILKTIPENLEDNLGNIYLKDRSKAIKHIEFGEIDIESHPWLSRPLRNHKLTPLRIFYTDGTSEIGIATRVDNEEFANILNAIDHCEYNDIPTYEAIGAITATVDYKFVITRFVEDVVPFSEYTVNDLNEFRQMLTSGLNTLKRLHSIGITHGDFEPRNIGISSEGVIYIFDFEGATIYSPDMPPQEEIKKDIEQFKRKLILQALKNPELIKSEVEAMADLY
jgi:serine/threonine protein kinase